MFLYTATLRQQNFHPFRQTQIRRHTLSSGEAWIPVILAERFSMRYVDTLEFPSSHPVGKAIRQSLTFRLINQQKSKTGENQNEEEFAHHHTLFGICIERV